MLGEGCARERVLVCPIIGLEVFPAEPEELPFHESSLVPVTAHEDTRSRFNKPRLSPRSAQVMA